MENDSDYGGTNYSVERQWTELDGESQGEMADMPSNYTDMQVVSTEDKTYTELTEPIESLNNPSYTDSLTSNDSETPLLIREQRENWTDKIVTEEVGETGNDIKHLENPAYINSVTSVENAPIDDTSKENNDGGDAINCLVELFEEPSLGKVELFEEPSIGKGKEFEVSFVEIVPHLASEGLWESTAYIDEFTCPSPSTRRLERVCKQAMLNLSQDISCKGSMKGSTLLPVLMNPVPEPVLAEDESFFEGNEIKNLLVISVSVSLMNAAFSSLRNLQSSLNHKDSVGLYSLTGSCGAFTILSLFTPSLIQQFRPKRCLVLSLFMHLLYVAANVIPEFYILIPVSVLQGAGSALMWNAVSTYITYLARSYAIRNDKRTVHVAAKYFGVFFCFFQMSVVVGNLISSVVLLQNANANKTVSITNDLTSIKYQRISNIVNNTAIDIPFNNLTKIGHDEQSICGSKYCHSYPVKHGTFSVDGNARYNLLGIYGVSTVLSLILPLFLMDALKNYRSTKINAKHIAAQASSVMRCIASPRFLTCLLMFFYSNMELGFVMAEVTKAFVTCPLGIHMVGYTMICFGVCGSISSFLGGKLEKHVGNVTLIATATIIDLVLLAVMLVWQPKPEPLFHYFLLLGAWGVGDGIWMSQVNCVISRLFPEQLEEAFASLRVINGLGMTVGFAYASSLCMTSKIYILFVVCLTGSAIYVISEIVRRCRSDKEGSKEEIIY